MFPTKERQWVGVRWGVELCGLCLVDGSIGRGVRFVLSGLSAEVESSQEACLLILEETLQSPSHQQEFEEIQESKPVLIDPQVQEVAECQKGYQFVRKHWKVREKDSRIVIIGIG